MRNFAIIDVQIYMFILRFIIPLQVYKVTRKRFLNFVMLDNRHEHQLTICPKFLIERVPFFTVYLQQHHHYHQYMHHSLPSYPTPHSLDIYCALILVLSQNSFLKSCILSHECLQSDQVK